MFLKFDVDLDSNLVDECGEGLHIYAADCFLLTVFLELYIDCAPLDDFLHLVEDFEPSKRRLSLDSLGRVVDVVLITMNELAKKQDLNALGHIQGITQFLCQRDR